MKRDKVIAYASIQLMPHEDRYRTHDLVLGGRGFRPLDLTELYIYGMMYHLCVSQEFEISYKSTQI